MEQAFTHMDFLATLFIFLIGCVAIALLLLFIHDKWQTHNAVKRNYPVIAWLRPLSERIGEFFRRYISYSDRKGEPFNRAIREWVYEAAEGKDDTRGFGSTRKQNSGNVFLLRSSVFPKEPEEFTDPPLLTIGSGCKFPYTPSSFFNMSALSFGAISAPAAEALALGTDMAGCWLNTGEGGLAPYHTVGGGDIVFEIGTAKYGVRDKQGNLDKEKLKELAQNPQIKMFEVKLSQGAKPGKGGILPAKKVTKEIAKIRNIPEGEDSVSPNRHKEAANTSELLDFVADLREITGKPIGIKTALGDPAWVQELCEEISGRGASSAPDFLTIDGSEGGSGAAPMMLMDWVALPIRVALPETAKILNEYKLKERIRLIVSGQLVTPGDVAWAMAAGADYVVSARGFMFAIGCIQAMRCHTNTCPSGVATHDKHLQKALKPQDKKHGVANYVNRLRDEVGLIARTCGLSHCREFTPDHIFIFNQPTQKEKNHA